MRLRRELPEYLKVPWGVRDVVVFVLAWFGLQLVVGLAVALLSPYLPPMKRFLDAIAAGNVDASFGLDLVGIVIGFGLIALFLRKYKANWSAVGWRRVSILKLLKYLAAALIIFVVLVNVALIVVKLLVPSFDANQPQTNDFTKAAGSHRSLEFDCAGSAAANFRGDGISGFYISGTIETGRNHLGCGIVFNTFRRGARAAKLIRLYLDPGITVVLYILQDAQHCPWSIAAYGE